MNEGDVGMTDRLKWETPSMPDTLGTTPVQEDEDAETLEVLMSLALDELLDEDGTARLELMLASDAAWSAEWEKWLAVDASLRSAPQVEPPADFLAGVEQKIVQLERRRRLWSGAIIGLSALLLWGSALVGLVSLGAFVLANQATWLNELIHGIALSWVRFTGLMQFLWYGALNLASTPQALALGICYGVMTAALLGLWIGLLRRTTRAGETLNA